MVKTTDKPKACAENIVLVGFACLTSPVAQEPSRWTVRRHALQAQLALSSNAEATKRLRAKTHLAPSACGPSLAVVKRLGCQDAASQTEVQASRAAMASAESFFSALDVLLLRCELATARAKAAKAKELQSSLRELRSRVFALQPCLHP
jgi:hypothetical protein